jgi:hypothetical protein
MKITDRVAAVPQRFSRLVDRVQYALDLGPTYPDLRDLRDEAESTIQVGVKTIYPSLERKPKIEKNPVKRTRGIFSRYQTLILPGMPKGIPGTDIHVKELGLVELYYSSNGRFKASNIYSRAIVAELEQKGLQITVGVGIGKSNIGFAYYEDTNLSTAYFPYNEARKSTQTRNVDKLREVLKGSLEEIGLAIILNKVLSTVNEGDVFPNARNFENIRSRLNVKAQELGLKPESLHGCIVDLYTQMR